MRLAMDDLNNEKKDGDKVYIHNGFAARRRRTLHKRKLRRKHGQAFVDIAMYPMVAEILARYRAKALANLH